LVHQCAYSVYEMVYSVVNTHQKSIIHPSHLPRFVDDVIALSHRVGIIVPVVIASVRQHVDAQGADASSHVTRVQHQLVLVLHRPALYVPPVAREQIVERPAGHVERYAGHGPENRHLPVGQLGPVTGPVDVHDAGSRLDVAIRFPVSEQTADERFDHGVLASFLFGVRLMSYHVVCNATKRVQDYQIQPSPYKIFSFFSIVILCSFCFFL